MRFFATKKLVFFERPSVTRAKYIHGFLVAKPLGRWFLAIPVI